VSRIRATSKSAKVLCCAAAQENDRRAGQVSLVGFSASRRNDDQCDSVKPYLL
jgi:hypothetical protein